MADLVVRSKKDLVLTGEGKFDNSSLAGKGPYALLAAAYSSGTSAILLAGLAEEEATGSCDRFPVLLSMITPKARLWNKPSN